MALESPILVPMPPTLDELARQRVRAWIAATGVSQSELAQRIGKNQVWLSRYLRGLYGADLQTLQTIARVFGHSVTALLDLPADPLEAKLIEHYRACPISDRQMLIGFAERLSQARRRPPTR